MIMKTVNIDELNEWSREVGVVFSSKANSKGSVHLKAMLNGTWQVVLDGNIHKVTTDPKEALDIFNSLLL